MTQYSIYLSGVLHQIDGAPDTTLASVRQMLGSDADNYDFVYYNPVTRRKTILNTRADETDSCLQDGFLFENNTMIMTVVQGDKTDLFGTKTDWLYNRNTGVQIVLNPEAAAQSANAGKFEPMMLKDIQPSNPSSNVFFDNAVICEKGSIIQFNVSSWGAAGFGYSITSDKDTICDGLYITYGDNPDHQAAASLARYQDSNNSIQIEGTDQLNIPTSDVVYYQKVTVKSWRVTGYTQNGQSFQNNEQAPVITAPVGHNFRSFAAFAADGAATGGFDPGPTGGNTYVPGGDIQTGAPGRGPTSSQQFGGISDVSQDDPNTTVLGAVVFYFFVFKDHDAANQVINILNAPNPNAFG